MAVTGVDVDQAIVDYPGEDVLVSVVSVMCLGQHFWGTQVSLYLNFRGTFTNSGGHTKPFQFLPVKLNSYPEISIHFFI